MPDSTISKGSPLEELLRMVDASSLTSAIKNEIHYYAKRVSAPEYDVLLAQRDQLLLAAKSALAAFIYFDTNSDYNWHTKQIKELEDAISAVKRKQLG